MIYVRDNGLSDSAHAIEFIEVPDCVPRDVVIKALEATGTWDPFPEVIAVAEKMTWIKHECTSIQEWLKDAFRSLPYGDEEVRRRLEALQEALNERKE